MLIEVSDNTIRKQAQGMGEKQSQREAAWIEEGHDEEWLQERERRIEEVPDVLYGSIDGAQVPVGEGWRELKSLCWYHVGDVYEQTEPKAQQISYPSEIAPAQESGRLLWAAGVRRLVDKAKKRIFVCDGAVWIRVILIIPWLRMLLTKQSPTTPITSTAWIKLSIVKMATGSKAARLKVPVNRMRPGALKLLVLAGPCRVPLAMKFLRLLVHPSSLPVS